MMCPSSPIVIIMGVSGCGKTIVGKALAKRLDCPFLEGDEFHPAENITKMRAGIPLNDDDRTGWMTAIRTAMEKQSSHAIVACSALKHKHRAYLSDFSRAVLFLHLTGERTLLEKRIGSRTGHFFDPNLLGSQLDALEPPQEDEEAITLRIDDEIENIVAVALLSLRGYGLYPPS